VDIRYENHEIVVRTLQWKFYPLISFLYMCVGIPDHECHARWKHCYYILKIV